MKKYRSYVKANKRLYAGYLRNACLGRDRTPPRVYDRLLFTFLSVNTSFDKTEVAYRAMRGKRWTNVQETMAELIKHGIHYAYTRSVYITDMTVAYINEPTVFLKTRKESWNQYRARLVHDIRGLGFIKVSFFITLVYPQADLCCLDRWILRGLGFQNITKTMRALTRQLTYQVIEHELRKEARACGVPLFQYQWATWDAIRGTEPEPMSSLWF